MLVAELALLLLDVVLKLLPDDVAVGQEHGKTLSHEVIRHEQSHFLADLAVVAGLGLLDFLLVLLELCLGCKCHAVDAGEHLVLGIVLPVGTALPCDLEGLEGIGEGHVRTCAHIDVIALLIEADDCIFGKISDVLFLVLGSALVHELDGLVAAEDERSDGKMLLCNLLHLGLDGQKVLVCELLVSEVDVIVEASLGGRAVCEIGLRIESLDGLGHQVSGRMSEDMVHLLCGAFGNGSVFVDYLHGLSP